MREHSSDRSADAGRRCRFLASVAIAFASVGAVSTGSVFAQGQEASIVGQVKDASGSVLPGVTVTAKSPSLQVPEIDAVTNEVGEYRLAPLPIGTYEVTYTLSGFQSFRQEEIRLTAGFIAKIDVTLKIGAVEETVTVSGASPVVDVTSTQTTTQMTLETLELIPSTRNGLLSLMAQSPSLRGNLDVGGSNFSAVPNFHAYGQDAEQWSTLEGILTEAPIGGSASGNYWDYTTFQETSVAGIGKTVEVPVRGVQLAGIVKSGGNNFHGGAFLSGTNGNFQNNNVDAALAKQLPSNTGNALQHQYDTNGEVGGRIIKDKLWFYVSGRRRALEENILGVNQSTPDDPNNTAAAYHNQSQTFGTGKMSYQFNTANKFIVFDTYTMKHEMPANSNVSTTSPWVTRQYSNVPTGTWKVEWQGVKGNVVADAQTGQWFYNADYFNFSMLPATNDITSGINGGSSTQGDKQYFRNARAHSSGSLSWYVPEGFLGNHQVKIGFDYMQESGYIGAKVRPQGDYQLLFKENTAGVPLPYEIATYNSPVSGINREHYLGLYTSDNWTISRRLTLNLGVRFERDNAFVPPQCSVAGTFSQALCVNQVQFNLWKAFAPRVSAAYDITGKGKTVLKLGWGRFDHKYTMGEVANANPLSSVTTTFFWHDNNTNNLYEPGEVNFDIANGGDYVSQSGAATGIPDPNEPQPKEDQFFAGFEHELFSNFAIRITGVYTRFFNVPLTEGLLRPGSVYTIPITKPDPGPDNSLGTADDPGTSLTYYDYPSTYHGPQFNQSEQTSPAGTPDQTFKTIEIQGTKRLSNGFQFTASYSATKKHIPFPEAAADNPNSFINTADNTWEWLGRISGAYRFRYGLLFAANYDSRNGTNQARTVLLSGGKEIPSITVNAGPIGSLQMPTIRSLDMRVEKTFALSAGQRLALRLNCYNTLNANTITSWSVKSGSTYLKPSAILPARVFELGASFTF
jgi:hypothetical protein